MKNKEYLNIQKEINHKIKTARQEHNYTVRELATLADMGYSYLSKLENNKIELPTLRTYLKLFEILEISPANLFNEIENMPPFSEQNNN